MTARGAILGVAGAAIAASIVAGCSATPASLPPSPQASPSASAVAAPRPTASIAAADPILDALLADYREAKLPFPPADAPLVRFDGEWCSQAPDGSCKPLQFLGFQLPPSAPGERPAILVGTRVHHPNERAAVTPVAADPAAAEGVNAEWRGATFEIDAALATGIQLHARGASALAARLVAIGVSADVGHWASMFRQAPNLPPRRAIAALIRASAANDLLDPGTDRAAIAAAFRRSLEIDRETPAPDTGAHASPDFGPFLRSLDHAMAKSAAAPGSIEALVDGLVDVTAPSSTLADRKPDPAYDRLAEKGFDAVPALIAHLDDDRLTRSVKVGFDNFPTYHQRVGDVVSDLLQAIAGSDLGKDWLRRQQGYGLERAPVEAWWTAARAQGEEAYLAQHVLPADPKAEWPNALELRILAKKYPAHLAGVYQTILDKRPSMQSWPVAKAIAASAIPAADKQRLLLRGAASAHLEHRRAALRELADLAPDAFVKILVQTLDAMPKTPKEPYWKSREGALANLVMETPDPRAWDALLRAAKRADVGLRLELLNPMNYAYIGDRQRAERIKFVAAFLDDTAVRDKTQSPEMWSGPSAAFTFPTIRVCDFAAMQIAAILRLKADPRPTWSAAQWDELRALVRKELARAPGASP